MFTRTARDDAEAACRHVFRGEDRSVAGRVVRHAVFTDPEVGAVGRRDFAGVAKARAIGSTVGVIKFVVDRATRTGPRLPHRWPRSRQPRA